jgi:hypothetical protein
LAGWLELPAFRLLLCLAVAKINQLKPRALTNRLLAVMSHFGNAIHGSHGNSPADINTCAAALVDWAGNASGQTNGAPIQKVMTYTTISNPKGDPEYTGATWPKDGDSPYGGCDGSDTSACAYRYGMSRAEFDANILPQSTSLFRAIDIEAEGYSWQKGGTLAEQEHNRAVVEGYVARSRELGTSDLGIYASTEDIASLLGPIQASSNLVSLPVWYRANARNVPQAQAACSLKSFTGGQVIMTQIVGGAIDRDLVCRPA